MFAHLAVAVVVVVVVVVKLLPLLLLVLRAWPVADSATRGMGSMGNSRCGCSKRGARGAGWAWDSTGSWCRRWLHRVVAERERERERERVSE